MIERNQPAKERPFHTAEAGREGESDETDEKTYISGNDGSRHDRT